MNKKEKEALKSMINNIHVYRNSIKSIIVSKKIKDELDLLSMYIEKEASIVTVAGDAYFTEDK